MGRTVPRSGHVPTTTSTPASLSRRTALDRCRTAVAGGVCVMMSFAPTKITARSGSIASATSTCSASSAEGAPDLPATTRRTGRSATAARPLASRTPGVLAGSVMPRPTEVESPSMAILSGSPGNAPYSPSATGPSSPWGRPMALRASSPSAISSPYAVAPRAVRPPPPSAAAVAIFRAARAMPAGQTTYVPSPVELGGSVCLKSSRGPATPTGPRPSAS